MPLKKRKSAVEPKIEPKKEVKSDLQVIDDYLQQPGFSISCTKGDGIRRPWAVDDSTGCRMTAATLQELIKGMRAHLALQEK
jgi:hypothetical protein